MCVFRHHIGSMIEKKGNQQSGNDFPFVFCCCYCPLLQLREPGAINLLRVDLRKRAVIDICDSYRNIELMLVPWPGTRDNFVMKVTIRISESGVKLMKVVDYCGSVAGRLVVPLLFCRALPLGGEGWEVGFCG